MLKYIQKLLNITNIFVLIKNIRSNIYYTSKNQKNYMYILIFLKYQI